MPLFTGESSIMHRWLKFEPEAMVCQWWIYFLKTHSFLLHNMLIDGLEKCGLLVDYCDVLSAVWTHSDGTHSLQRIHWWTSDAMILWVTKNGTSKASLRKLSFSVFILRSVMTGKLDQNLMIIFSTKRKAKPYNQFNFFVYLISFFSNSVWCQTFVLHMCFVVWTA